MRDAVSQSNGAGAPAFPRRAAALRISRKGSVARIEKSRAVPGSDRRPPVLQKAAFPAPFGRPHRSRKMLRHKSLGPCPKPYAATFSISVASTQREQKRSSSFKPVYRNAADGRIWLLPLHQGTPRIFQPLQIQPVDQLNQKGLRTYSCTRPAESTAKQRDVRQNAQRHFCQR